METLPIKVEDCNINIGFFEDNSFIVKEKPDYVEIEAKNNNLHKAKKEKNDEFYTRLEDIEAELSHYPAEYFKDKVIYLPTDVAVTDGAVQQSAFVQYFKMNAERLQFKKLIATCLEDKAANPNEVDYSNVKNCYILERVD